MVTEWVSVEPRPSGKKAFAGRKKLKQEPTKGIGLPLVLSPSFHGPGSKGVPVSASAPPNVIWWRLYRTRSPEDHCLRAASPGGSLRPSLVAVGVPWLGTQELSPPGRAWWLEKDIRQNKDVLAPFPMTVTLLYLTLCG